MQTLHHALISLNNFFSCCKHLTIDHHWRTETMSKLTVQSQFLPNKFFSCDFFKLIFGEKKKKNLSKSENCEFIKALNFSFSSFFKTSPKQAQFDSINLYVFLYNYLFIISDITMNCNETS